MYVCLKRYPANSHRKTIARLLAFTLLVLFNTFHGRIDANELTLQLREEGEPALLGLQASRSPSKEETTEHGNIIHHFATCSCSGCASQPQAAGTITRKSTRNFQFDFPGTISPLEASKTNAVYVVDLMVMYTPAALAGAGGSDAMRNVIDLAIAEANTVFQNSSANVRLRLVYHAEATNYVEASNLSTNLVRLRNKTDGFMDEAHILRDLHKADLVCLITEQADNGFSGLAFTMSSPTASFKDSAFTVVQRSAMNGSYLLAHEIGHNLGCQHDRENLQESDGQLGNGAFPYSFGHRFLADGTLYRTVMAYAPGEPIPYFSNPNIFFKGVPTGLAGITNGANNVLTINSTASMVSGFYGPVVQTAPPQVEITLPSTNIITVAGSDVVLTAIATDQDGGLRQVEFYANGTVVAVNSTLVNPDTLPIVITNFVSSSLWTNIPPGEFRVTARATDNLGASSASIPVTIIARPLNDSYSHRIPVTGADPTVAGSNRAATLEEGEAMHTGNPGGSSVWYSWTAPRSGTISLSATGIRIVPLPEVYRTYFDGTIEPVTRDLDFDEENYRTTGTVDVISGATYSIAVDSLSGIGGEFQLSLTLQKPPENDDIAHRIAVIGSSFTLSGNNRTATPEPQEPPHAANVGGKSVWYAWEAPRSGTFNLKATASDFFPLLGIYRGTSISTLTNLQPIYTFDVTNKILSITFNADAGTSYSIAVDGANGNSGPFTLDLTFPPSPVNDDFANRSPIHGDSISLETSNLNATFETGEPDHLGQAGKKSIWFSWTAPVSGPVIILTRAENFYILPEAYTGSQLDTLQPIPGRTLSFSTNITSTLTFNAVAFKTYALAMDGFQGRNGSFTLTLKTQNMPPAIQLSSENNGGLNFGFHVLGSVGQGYAIEASSNLVDWIEAFRGTFAAEKTMFNDQNSSSLPRRFYRIRPLP